MIKFKLDKGEAIITTLDCVNSNWKARFFAKDDEECCQCSWGECKVKVSIAYNGHNPHQHILTSGEIKSLPLTDK